MPLGEPESRARNTQEEYVFLFFLCAQGGLCLHGLTAFAMLTPRAGEMQGPKGAQQQITIFRV